MPAVLSHMAKSSNTPESTGIPPNTHGIPPEYPSNIHHILGIVVGLFAFTRGSSASISKETTASCNIHDIRVICMIPSIDIRWLADRRNVVVVWLQSKAWVGESADKAGQPPQDLPPKLELRQWNVAELAGRVEAADAEGLAAMLRRSSVNGAAFADLDVSGFVEDLGFTLFAAKKLVALRNAFLAEEG